MSVRQSRDGHTMVDVMFALAAALFLAVPRPVAAPAASVADPWKAGRAVMVDLIAGRGVRDRATLDALGTVPRHEFVRPEHEEDAYGDHPLPIGHGQTISQPYIVAFMTEALGLVGGEKVLEVGTGSGYQAAVLAELARRVYSIERYKPLSREAERLLIELGIYNVVFDVGDGSKGWPGQAPFDRIIVTAAAEERPQALIDQLAVGGILIVPVGRDPTAQVVERIVKSESGLQRDTLMPVRFVPLVTGALPVLGQG
jgi:protein-L-isoaspartate(D-aspartate) O-methyltransferase